MESETWAAVLNSQKASRSLDAAGIRCRGWLGVLAQAALGVIRLGNGLGLGIVGHHGTPSDFLLLHSLFPDWYYSTILGLICP